MTSDLSPGGTPSFPSRDQSPASCTSVSSSASSQDFELVFDETQCLFCNDISPDLVSNISHMSKTHGLHIEMTNLVVDVASLLAYFHVVIFECYECLYCGTQRNTRQAAQQHMMGKAHCKYDLEGDADVRDFYDLSSPDERADPASRLPERTRLSSSKRSRQSRRQVPHRTTDEQDLPPNEPPQSDDEAVSPSSSQNNALSARVLKQEHTLNTQLAQLRAEDRRSLAHLPTSQQRALLATHFKQAEKAKKSEQIKRTRLETAGNHFGRLGTVRLVRQPPHFGNVSGLNR